jgi:6-pyruvoyltetrahydropterin/6-carboxytetrahydropterin synthase
MLHGHRYTVEATFKTDDLDELGMVMDFGIIKEKFKEWLMHNWDHNTILSVQDRELGDKIAKSTGQKICYIDTNPTAENMGYYLLHAVCPLIFKSARAKCVKIKLYETPNCYATVKL